MKELHVSFGQLSDFMDDAIPTEEEQKTIRVHLESCPLCTTEYERLQSALQLVSQLRFPVPGLDFLPGKVVSTCKFRQQKKRFLRYSPAAAAAIVLITGFAFIQGGMFSDNSVYYASDVQTASESESVLEIIRDHEARILQVTDLFVEGEISTSEYSDLKRDLGMRNVVVVSDKPVSQTSSTPWRSGISEVGTASQPAAEVKQNKDVVKFRIFR